MSPSEQQLSASQDPPSMEVPLVVTVKAPSPTMFQIGEPPEEEQGEIPPVAKETDKETTGTQEETETAQVGESGGVATSEVKEEESASQPVPTDSGLVQRQGSCGDDITGLLEESTDQGGSIMLAESNLSLDMTCVVRAASSDKLGSPVLPTTSLEEVAMTTERDDEQERSPSLTQDKSVEEEAEPASEATPTFVAVDLERVEEELEGVHLTPSISDSVPDVTIDLEEGAGPVFSDEEEAPASLEPSIAVQEVTESLFEVPEEVQRAWVPSPPTQALLSQPQQTKDPSHLTCPALVADVRMVGPPVIAQATLSINSS